MPAYVHVQAAQVRFLFVSCFFFCPGINVETDRRFLRWMVVVVGAFSASPLVNRRWEECPRANDATLRLGRHSDGQKQRGRRSKRSNVSSEPSIDGPGQGWQAARKRTLDFGSCRSFSKRTMSRTPSLGSLVLLEQVRSNASCRVVRSVPVSS
ncbi:hypothetical protein IWX50DRAFT_299414 [Phyllosticta citricarpa]